MSAVVSKPASKNRTAFISNFFHSNINRHMKCVPTNYLGDDKLFDFLLSVHRYFFSIDFSLCFQNSLGGGFDDIVVLLLIPNNLSFSSREIFLLLSIFFTWDEPTLSLRTSSRILKKYLISLLSNTSANLFSKSPKATVECEILVISFLVSLFSSMERTWYQYHRRFCYIWIIDRFGINHEFTIFFVQVVNSQAKSAFVDHLHRKRAEYPEIKDKHALFYTFS